MWGGVFLNICKVFYSEWEMACCGVPFKIRDTINWIVSKCEDDMFSGDYGVSIVDKKDIDYSYDEHSNDLERLYKLNGIVVEIQAIHYKFEQSKNSQYMIRTSGVLIKENSAGFGEEQKIDGMGIDAYYITLDLISVVPAQKSDVTYK